MSQSMIDRTQIVSPRLSFLSFSLAQLIDFCTWAGLEKDEKKEKCGHGVNGQRPCRISLFSFLTVPTHKYIFDHLCVDSQLKEKRPLREHSHRGPSISSFLFFFLSDVMVHLCVVPRSGEWRSDGIAALCAFRHSFSSFSFPVGQHPKNASCWPRKRKEEKTAYARISAHYKFLVSLLIYEKWADKVARSGAWAWKREAFWLSVSPLLTPHRIS